MNASTTIDRLTEVLEPSLTQLGLDLEGIDLSSAGKRRVLRIAVDKDGGVDMDEIADATREVSGLLDEGGPHADIMGQQPYTLEVSSPGIDRPLTLPRHWRRNRTRLVKVTPVEGEAFTGRVVEAGEESVTLDVDGSTREVSLADVKKAQVQIEFKREG